MKKVDAFVAGTAAASVGAALGFGIYARNVTDGFFFGLGYVAFCGVEAGMIVMHAKSKGEFEAMTAREWFWWPFFPIAMGPLLLACGAVVSDWQIHHPLRRRIGIGALFVAAVLSFLLLFWLMDRRRRKKPDGGGAED